MLQNIIRFDLLLIILFVILFIEKVLTSLLIAPFFMIFFLICILFVYIVENKIKINIFIIFFIYLFIRTLFNLFNSDIYLFQVGFSTSIQVLSYGSIMAGVYYFAQYNEKRIIPLFTIIKVFILLNTLILILSAFNIYIFDKDLYESYGHRHFGIIGDQLPWIITLIVAYSVNYKKYYMLCFCFLGLWFTGSLNASVLALLILFYYIFKEISLKNIFYVCIFIIIIIILLYYSNFFWRLSSGNYENSLGYRILSIGFAISNINSYFFGNGYGTYSYINENNIVDPMINQVIFSNTFNQYLQIFLDLGIFGLILFLILCYKIFKLKTYKFYYFKIWIISFLIFNQSAVWLLPSSYICILISIGLGLLIYEDKKIRTNAYNRKKLYVNKKIT